MSRRTLYVSGFSSRTRAKDLAQEFEKFGRLVRCDIPAPKTPTSRVFAFVEFEDDRDAEDAFRDMHNRPMAGDEDHILNIQWAKQPPSSMWRFDGPPAPRRDDGGRPSDGPRRDRSPPRRRSPPRDSYGAPPPLPAGPSADRSRGRSRSPPRRRDYDDRPPARGYDDRAPIGRDAYDDRRGAPLPPPVDDRRDGRGDYRDY